MSESTYMYILCSVVFSGVILILLISFRDILRLGEKPSPGLWVALLGIILFGGWLRFSQAPQRFKVFYDEYENYNSSRMIERHGDFMFCELGTVDRCEKRSQPIHPVGFPFLGAQALRVTGSEKPDTLFRLNALLGTLCIPTMFLLGIAIGAGAASALFIGLLTAMLPLHVALSTSAGPDAANFLMLSFFWVFLIAYIRTKKAIPAAGLLFSIIGAILIRPENVLCLIFAAVVVLASRPLKKMEIVCTVCGVLAVAAAFLPVFAAYRSIFETNRLYISSYESGFFHTLKGNLLFFFKNPLLVWFFFALALGGVAITAKKLGYGLWMAAFFVLYLGVFSVLNIQFWQGDFSRHALSVSICIVYWGGIFLGYFSGKMTQYGFKAILSAAVIMMVFVCYNRIFTPFTDYLELQDSFFAETLPSIPVKCSIFSPNTSAGMLFTANRSYDTDQLLNDAFMRKHGECKVFVSDVLCASSFYDKCRAINTKYKIELLSSRDLRVFTVSVGKLKGTAP